MKDTNLTKSQLKIIEKSIIYVEKFKKINIILHQPWRRCHDNYKNDADNIINELQYLIIGIKSGLIDDVDASIIMSVIEIKEKLIYCEFKNQNIQKLSGKEVTPFGELDLYE